MVVKTLDGTSFAGLIRYMTHDAPERGSKPTTTERVGFCRCDNVPTDDPEMASRIMAATVRDAEYLKAAAGVSARGRKLQRPVKHFIISWPKGAEPSETEQLEAVSGLLTELDLEDRQRVTVSHRDRGHRHVHVCVNRVSHVDGRAAPLHHERRECSTWAEKFERERRQRIECPVRVENRQRRERREGPTIHTVRKRRRRDTGEPVDPLPGETKLWAMHFQAWKHIPADDPSARRTRHELARNLEAVRDDAGPAPGATLERRPRPPLYSRAEIEMETRLRRERAARQPAAARDQAAAPPPPRRQQAPVELAPRPDEETRREEERQPDEERREEERIAAGRRTEMRFVHVRAHAIFDAERGAAELANRWPAPTRALCLAAQEGLEHAAGGRYTATPEVSGTPLAVGQLRQELEREILDILAGPEHASRHARIPPPRPEAVAEMVQAVQDLADRRIHHAAVEEGLDLPQAERAPTAAPADEQPAPPASEAPQHPSLAVREESERQPVRREPAAGRPSPSADEQHPDRGAGQGPGGATSPPVRKDQRRGRE